MNSDPLAGLRDIHFPPDPGWWPPAPGYWLIAGLIGGLVLLGIAAAVLHRYRRRRAPLLRKLARNELGGAKRRFALQGNSQQLAIELSGLLRRAAIAWHGSSVASLSGHAWAEYLTKTSPARCNPELWEYLAVRRYGSRPDVPNADELLRQCRRWLDKASQ